MLRAMIIAYLSVSAETYKVIKSFLRGNFLSVAVTVTFEPARLPILRLYCRIRRYIAAPSITIKLENTTLSYGFGLLFCLVPAHTRSMRKSATTCDILRPQGVKIRPLLTPRRPHLIYSKYDAL